MKKFHFNMQNKKPRNPYLMNREELLPYLNKTRAWLFEFGSGKEPHPRTKEVELAFSRAVHAYETYDRRLTDLDFQLICESLL